jgi:hypothetical protein
MLRGFPASLQYIITVPRMRYHSRMDRETRHNIKREPRREHCSIPLDPTNDECRQIILDTVKRVMAMDGDALADCPSIGASMHRVSA